MAQKKPYKIKNIGSVSQKWLDEIGVHTLDDVQRVGVEKIYWVLKTKGYPVSLNLVYALQAAIMDLHWMELPPEIKFELKAKLGR